MYNRLHTHTHHILCALFPPCPIGGNQGFANGLLKTPTFLATLAATAATAARRWILKLLLVHSVSLYGFLTSRLAGRKDEAMSMPTLTPGCQSKSRSGRRSCQGRSKAGEWSLGRDREASSLELARGAVYLYSLLGQLPGPLGPIRRRFEGEREGDQNATLRQLKHRHANLSMQTCKIMT